MRIDRIEVMQFRLPMVDSLAAAHGTVTYRDLNLVRIDAEGAVGWGECVALPEPTYNAEYSDGEYSFLVDRAASSLVGRAADSRLVKAETGLCFAGHLSSRAAIEMALMDIELKADGQSLAAHLDAGETVEACAVVGLGSSTRTISQIGKRLEDGYQHFKIKITPGMDLERLAVIHAHFPNINYRLDANGSYDWRNKQHQKQLTDIAQFAPAYLEQPLPVAQDTMLDELKAATGLRVAVDESLTTLEASLAMLELVGVDALVVKPGNVGGILPAIRIAAEAKNCGKRVALGGMLDGGLSRAANLCIAASSGFSEQPAEVSGDGRWFEESFVHEPTALRHGRLSVPNEPGIGVTVNEEVVRRFQVRAESFVG